MLRHAKAILDRGIASRGIEARGSADFTRGNAAEFLDGLGTVTLLGNETRPVQELVPIATGANEGFVHKAFRDDHMRERRDDGDIGTRPQGEMVICRDVRRTHQIRPARVDDDELCAFPQTLFHPRSEDRMRVSWIAADDEDDIGFIDGVEILGSRRRAESLAQSIASRRMATLAQVSTLLLPKPLRISF